MRAGLQSLTVGHYDMGLPMTTPLEIMIALHYHTTSGKYSEHDLVHANSTAVVSAKARLNKLGLLNRLEFDYEAGPALAVWVQALQNVPFPVQQWVIPNGSLRQMREAQDQEGQERLSELHAMRAIRTSLEDNECQEY